MGMTIVDRMVRPRSCPASDLSCPGGVEDEEYAMTEQGQSTFRGASVDGGEVTLWVYFRRAISRTAPSRIGASPTLSELSPDAAGVKVLSHAVYFAVRV
jgi:hypothetical protein